MTATLTPNQLALLRRIDECDQVGRPLMMFDIFYGLVDLAKGGGEKLFVIVNAGEVELTWAGRAALANARKALREARP